MSRTMSRPSPTWQYLIAFGGAFAAWVLQFGIDYILVDYGCGGSRLAIRLISVVALAAALGSAYMAWSLFKLNRDVRTGDLETDDLIRFGGMFGLLSSGLFLGLVILTGAATMVLSPCAH